MKTLFIQIVKTSRSTGLYYRVIKGIIKYYRVQENSIGIKMSKDGIVIRRFDFALILQLLGPLTQCLKFRNLRIPRL